MNQNFCLIFYHVPQDQDGIEEPNAYGISIAKDNITFRDIKRTFPLEGQYIFRFKYKIGTQIVWMDLNSDDAKPPQFNNRIYIKATRISWNINNLKSNPSSQKELKQKDLPQNGNSFSSKDLSPVKQEPIQNKQESDLLDF